MLERVLRKGDAGLLVRLISPVRWEPRYVHRRSSKFATGTARSGEVTRERLAEQVDVCREHDLVEAELEPAGRLLTTYRVLDCEHPAGVGRIDDCAQRLPECLAAPVHPEAHAQAEVHGTDVEPGNTGTRAISATAAAPRASSIIGNTNGRTWETSPGSGRMP